MKILSTLVLGATLIASPAMAQGWQGGGHGGHWGGGGGGPGWRGGPGCRGGPGWRGGYGGGWGPGAAIAGGLLGLGIAGAAAGAYYAHLSVTGPTMHGGGRINSASEGSG